MAKAKHTKTNAVRLLEAAKVPFLTREYSVDEEHLDAQHVADLIGEDINRVFKTLVLRGERTGLFVCVVPGNCGVDLKKAALDYDFIYVSAGMRGLQLEIEPRTLIDFVGAEVKDLTKD